MILQSKNSRGLITRAAALLFAFVILFGLMPVAVNADVSDGTSADPVLETPYAAIRNVDTGKNVFEKDADKKIAPASTVKLMVALVAYEKLGSDKTKTYAASSSALKNISGNNIAIREGEEFKLTDLLAGVIVSCANDACNVIAEAAGGSVSNFVKLMNDKAAELGMTSTNYTNTSGMDDSDMYTTASDIAKLAEAVYKVNDLAVIADMPKHVIPATNKSTNQRNLLNKNHLVSTFTTTKYYYDPAVGLNAGYTDDGGHCLVTANYNDNKELTYVYVLMGWQGPSNSITEETIKPYLEVKDMITWADKNFKKETKKASSEMLGEIKVQMGSSADSVVIRPAKDIDIIIDERKPYDVKYVPSINFNDESLVLEAPVQANMVVGKVDIYVDGKLYETVDLITMTAVSRDNFGYIMGQIGDFFKSKTLKTIIIIFLVLIGLYLLLSVTLKILNIVKKYKRRQEKKQRAKERRELEEKGLAPPPAKRSRRVDDEDDEDDDEDDDEYDY